MCLPFLHVAEPKLLRAWREARPHTVSLRDLTPCPFAVTSRSAFPPAACSRSPAQAAGSPVSSASSILFKFKVVFVWKVVSLCFAQIRIWKRQERVLEFSRGRMKSECLTRWRQDWPAARGKFQSRQLHSASRKLPSELRFTAVRLCVSGCLADWQLLGGCLLNVASACTSSPLASAGGGEVGVGVGRCT